MVYHANKDLPPLQGIFIKLPLLPLLSTHLTAAHTCLGSHEGFAVRVTRAVKLFRKAILARAHRLEFLHPTIT